MKRHIGKVTNTDQRCAIVMMQIPGREDHALIVPVDNLPPRYEQAVMSLLESPEGQSEEMLYAILDRRIMPDTGKKVLVTLHEAGLLTAVPVSNITMMPLPHQPVPLLTLLRQMGRVVPEQTAATPATEKFNPHVANQSAGRVEETLGKANNLLIEAEMLEREAKRKREQAYSFNPSLRPAEPFVPATPSVTAIRPMFEDVPNPASIGSED